MDSKKFTIIVAALTMVFCLLTVVYNFASVPAYGEAAAEAVPIYLPSQSQSVSDDKAREQGASSEVTDESSAESSSNNQINTNSSSKATNQSKTSTSTAVKKPVNINTADVAELSTVKYIAEARAQAIIDYRNTHGKFKSIDELDNVKGFGQAMIEKIRSEITV